MPANRRIQTPVTLRNLPSTIADLLDYEDEPPFPGQSLARHWEGVSNHENLQEELLLSEANHTTGRPDWFPVSKGDMYSVVFQGKRYIRNGDGQEELYDFYEDPQEQNNLAQSDGNRIMLQQYRLLLDEMVVR
jgi:arylsulfatase A-like enzyme